jgi:transposase
LRQKKDSRPFTQAKRACKDRELELLNALVYRCENGCKWRALPEKFGHGIAGDGWNTKINALAGDDRVIVGFSLSPGLTRAERLDL